MNVEQAIASLESIVSIYTRGDVRRRADHAIDVLNKEIKTKSELLNSTVREIVVEERVNPTTKKTAKRNHRSMQEGEL